MFASQNDPIICCSTSRVGISAIALIRLSGKFSLIDFQKSFNKNLSKIKSNQAIVTNLINHLTNEVIDEVVITFFQNPKSYTGENVLEISCHGNNFIIDTILEYFCANYSFRIASPGEFTYRALKNGKMSLVQVEGLDLLLHAGSDYALKQGKSLLSGELYQSYDNLYKIYFELRMKLEILINFSDDVGEEEALDGLKQTYTKYFKACNSLFERIHKNSFSLIRPKITICGNVNNGKSTFFNLMLNSDRSIVSNIEGTTTDYISDDIIINGNRFELIDTAGIRETSREIEQEGIKRSLNLIESSFLRILVTSHKDDIHNSDYLKLIKKADIILITHLNELKDKEINHLKDSLIKLSTNKDLLVISTDLVSDEQLNNLSLIKNEIINKFNSLTKNDPIVLDRHITEIKKINEVNNNYLKELQANTPDLGIVSNHLYEIKDHIEQLIGIIVPDLVLNDIFSNYCIGK